MRIKHIFVNLTVVLILLCAAAPLMAQKQVLLHHGHSHNDYKQKRPLIDALENGFTSIEVDIFLYNGSIRVSHISPRLKKKPDLETLYLKPLKERIDQNGGTVFPGDSTQLVLLIDMKSERRELFTLLEETFKPYAHMIQSFSKDHPSWAPLVVILTNSPPLDLLISAADSVFRIDGSFYRNNSGYSPGFMPRLSSNYKNHLKWRGRGKMSDNDKQALELLVSKAKGEQRKARFYASPKKEQVWEVLLDAGVHWINVDHLKRFRKFYLDYDDRKN